MFARHLKKPSFVGIVLLSTSAQVVIEWISYLFGHLEIGKFHMGRLLKSLFLIHKSEYDYLSDPASVVS
jgi:hypothetical protein